jgi:hypothetical protein
MPAPEPNTVVTVRAAAHPAGERLAFLYDTERIQPSGLVGEIVLPPIGEDPQRQFARSPYFAGFSRAGTEFTLASVHILWGTPRGTGSPKSPRSRSGCGTGPTRPNDWNHNLMVLGDFNLDRIGDPLYETFVATGLWPPAELNNVPRTIFDDDKSQHFYDQIAWFSEPDGAPLLDGIAYSPAGGLLRRYPHIMTGLTRNEISWRISDHYPLWAEFRLAIWRSLWLFLCDAVHEGGLDDPHG